MKRCFALVLGLVGMVAGCDENVVAAGCGDISTSASEHIVSPPVPTDGTCSPSLEDITNTRLASVVYDTIIIKCSYCDEEGCNHLGARCDADGAACDYHGELGTCQSCCDSEFGELHCGPHQ